MVILVLHVRIAMTSSISASMKSHSIALAQSVTLQISRQGNSEAAILTILDSYLVSRTPISAAKDTPMIVVTTGLTFVHRKKGISGIGAVWNSALILVGLPRSLPKNAPPNLNVRQYPHWPTMLLACSPPLCVSVLGRYTAFVDRSRRMLLARSDFEEIAMTTFTWIIDLISLKGGQSSTDSESPGTTIED